MERVGRQDLANAIAKKTGLRQDDVYAVIDLLCDDIKKHAHEGKMVELRRFGTFYPYHKKERTYKVPRLREERTMRGRTTLKFKPSKHVILFDFVE